MSTLCSSDGTVHLLLTLFLDIVSLFSFLTSHPLCLAYLFLLTPHIFPIISFLFPLLLSTSLLILLTLLISTPCYDSLFSVYPHLPSSAFRAVLDILKDRFDGDDMVLCSDVIECLLGDGLILWDLEEPGLVCADRESPEEETEQDEILGGLGATNVAELEYNAAEDVLEKSENPASDWGDGLILWDLEEPSLVCADCKSLEEETEQDEILGGLWATNVAELEYKVGEDVLEKSENPASDLGDGLILWDLEEPGLVCADRKSLEEETEQDEILGGLGATNVAELEYKVAEDVLEKSENPASDLGIGLILCDLGAMDESYKELSLVCADRKSPEEEIEQDEILDGLGTTNGAELEHKVAEDVPEVPGEMVARNVVGCLSRSISTRATTKKEHLRTASFGGLRRDGSMGKEKEWNRTLACKIYEERITFKLYEEKGGEDMDLLWEAYEDDANKNGSKPKEKKQEKTEDGYDEEEDDDTVQKLCCLQAFRLSAGKMNLGVGGPNLAKVSKALKGIGLFQKVIMSSKSSRKK